MDSISQYLFHWGFWATVLQLTVVVGVILRVILTRHPPGSSFAWILITLALPYIGFVLYLLFGERPIGRLRAWRYRRLMQGWLRFVQSSPSPDLPPDVESHRPLINLACRCAQMNVTVGSHLQLLDSPEKSFDAIIEAIHGAKRRIDMAFYIWHTGGRENDVAQALYQARQRGVQIRILVDAFGSAPFLKSDTYRHFIAAGMEVSDAMPMGLLKTFGLQRADIRLHRKLVIVDNKIAFTGSLNMIDPSVYPDAKKVGAWVDAMVRIEGPGVVPLSMIFYTDWMIQPDHEQDHDSPKHHVSIEETGTATMVAVPSGPNTQTADPNLHLILEAINDAKHSLTLTTPYFVPNESLASALLNACYRGVSVTLIIPKHGNNRAVTYASRRYFDDLLNAGARILLFTGGLLHTKSICVDGEYVVFGTVNLDNRSLHLNYELMLLIFDTQFVADFDGLLKRYEAQSQCLNLGDWRHRPIRERLLEGASFLISPLL